MGTSREKREEAHTHVTHFHHLSVVILKLKKHSFSSISFMPYLTYEVRVVQK